MQNRVIPNTSEEAIEIARQDIEKKYGIVFPTVENGFACGEFPLSDERRNFYGIPYGGMMFHLADITSGMAFLSVGGNGITVSGNVNYLRGASPEADKLVCHASVKKAGRNLFFLSAEVMDNFGTVLSEYSFVFTNLSKTKEKDQ